MVRSLIQTAAVAATVAWYARSSAAAPAVTSGAVDVTATGTSAHPRASGMPHGHDHGHNHSKECNSQVSGVPTSFPGDSSADSPPLSTASAALSDSALSAEPSGGPSRRHGGHGAPGGNNTGPGDGGKKGHHGHPHKSAESRPANSTESGHTNRRIAKLSRMNALN
ncbi:hypothetical protein GGX14DRAFT_586018 [Mycena pura]|uniref:Uncharacterized protein n=1 Tax=Mycena pura TaxID=153505 RepID=A0AAD6VQT0_9AGAR|nr:hypothetical protein GGX14DRAFT_586018 [Mycena pura]